MRTTDRVIEHFGGKDEAIAALGINPETWRLWTHKGIPLGKSLFVEEKTGGAIKAEQIVAEAREAA
jgi:hypothetical protein